MSARRLNNKMTRNPPLPQGLQKSVENTEKVCKHIALEVNKRGRPSKWPPERLPSIFPIIPWRKYDSQRPLFGGDFLGQKSWRPIRSRALLFTPDRKPMLPLQDIGGRDCPQKLPATVGPLSGNGLFLTNPKTL